MNENELKVLQQEQVRIMDAIHAFCVANGITYYMIGGTLLGAVRHGGFIPWDLDIDIAMMRADYEKFRELFEKETGDLICNTYHRDPYYLRPHMEVFNKNSHIVSRYDKYNKRTMYRGIFVDVFPIDRVPESEKDRQAQKKKVAKYKKMQYYKSAFFYKREALPKVLAKKAISLSLLPHSELSICRKMDAAMQKYEKDTSLTYVCSMASHYSYEKQTMPYEYYGEPVLIPFDGRNYYAPAKTHEYLTRLYGDYMTPPSKTQQIAQMNEFDSIIMKEGLYE